MWSTAVVRTNQSLSTNHQSWTTSADGFFLIQSFEKLFVILKNFRFKPFSIPVTWGGCLLAWISSDWLHPPSSGLFILVTIIPTDATVKFRFSPFKMIYLLNLKCIRKIHFDEESRSCRNQISMLGNNWKCRLCKIAFSKIRWNGPEEPFREHFLLDSLEPHILYV